MKKAFSYISLFLCAFMLVGSFLRVDAAEYDVYEVGDTITKQMTSGKNVQFTVIEDEGANSQYVKVIANPSDLSQFGVTTAYSYNDITSNNSSGAWTQNQLAITDTLGKLWGESGTARIKEGSSDYTISVLEKADYDDFRDKYATKNYNSTYSSLSSENQTKVDTEIAAILKGQTFWVLNFNDSNVLQYDRIVDGTYTTTEMDETAKGNALNVTVVATICKEPKQICRYDQSTDTYYGSKGDVVTAEEYEQQCGNPDTADNNVLILTLIAAGCVLCIVGFGRKILAK